MPLDRIARDTVAEEELEACCTGLILAVSGGADSMAMLRWYASRTLPFPLTVAHVHHGLRAASDEEEALVRQICEAYRIPCHVFHTRVRKEKRKDETEESAARRLRYEFFRELAKTQKASHIATAHTADDQAETVLLHLIHGAGPKGLCGILPKREEEGLTLIRPLIRCTAEETRNYCAEQGVPYATDESNEDLRYTRNRIRHRILPELRRINPKVTEALNRTASALQKQQQAAEKRAADFLKSYSHALPLSALRELTEADRTEVLRQWFASFGKILSAEQTKQALHLLQKQEGTVEFDRRWIMHAGQNRLSLQEKEAAAKTSFFSVEEERFLLPDGRILRLIPTVATERNRDALIPKTLPLTLRTRKNGDKIATRAGTRPLAKHMMERKIPAEKRNGLWLLTRGEEILWCEGLPLPLKTAPKPGEEAYFVSLSAE